jgi:glycine cleavage system H protein
MHFFKKTERSAVEIKHDKLSDSKLQLEKYVYSRNHCWIKKMTDNVVRVGIEPGFASLLLSPKAIVLPSIGETVRQDQSCCWIVMDGGTMPLDSPISGIVSITNSRLGEAPYELCANPCTSGWLFQIQCSQIEGEILYLLEKQEAETLYAKDVATFDTLVRNAFKKNNTPVGFTLPDGGQALSDISTMLGPRRYLELLREAFR